MVFGDKVLMLLPNTFITTRLPNGRLVDELVWFIAFSGVNMAQWLADWLPFQEVRVRFLTADMIICDIYK